MISRTLQSKIIESLSLKKAVIVLGARQTGKTTLLKLLFGNNDKTLWLNADEPDTHAIFENASSARFKSIFSPFKTVVIDEAQRLKDIGLKLKLITDNIPEIQLIATGSSAFELSNKINEPLTGRKIEFKLFPLSYAEMVNHHGIITENRLLPQRLIYGSYPEIINNPGNEKNILKQLTDSYLYKDILMWEQIKKPEKLLKLLQALAFQVGNEVSNNELGKLVGLDNETIDKYIQLLEQTYVIFRLSSFSRNLRKELRTGKKIYFYDNGIRNALIASFAPIELRNDIGALWENYLISERKKFIEYNGFWQNTYFWRTQDQQEIDYLEERNGKLFAFEFKWNANKQPRLSKSFALSYPEHEYKVITQNNFEEFIL